MSNNRQIGIFLSLGSNVGNRQSNLSNCIGRLSEISGLSIVNLSSIYETEPVGFENQDMFLNIVLEITYKGTPVELLKSVKNIENKMGRKTSLQWGPRIIDVDILYFNDIVIESATITIPHPEIQNRRFVLEPLAEIAPDFQCPNSFYSVRELFDNNCDAHDVVKYLLLEWKELFHVSKTL